MKKCYGCKKNRPVSDFNKHRGRKDGLSEYCKECRSKMRKTQSYREKSNQQSKRWRAKPENNEKQKKWAKKFRTSETGKEYIKNDMLKRTYGISLKEYNLMFEKQKGNCAICNKHQTKFIRNFSVDHDHKTGIIRGLLCHHCNTSLGSFNDDINILKNAIKYLKKHRKDIK